MRLFFAFAGIVLASAPGVEELHRAARSGDLKQVESLIERGTPVNSRDSLGGTPLHDAAWAGEAEIVEYLIRAGSKLFKSDTVFEGTRTRYVAMGAMLPTVVRFVGTRVITVPRDAPASGTITEKVPVLHEVSLPMHSTEELPGYAKFEVIGAAPASLSGKK